MWSNLHVTGLPCVEKEIMAPKHSNLVQTINPQIQVTQKTLNTYI